MEKYNVLWIQKDRFFSRLVRLMAIVLSPTHDGVVLVFFVKELNRNDTRCRYSVL